MFYDLHYSTAINGSKEKFKIIFVVSCSFSYKSINILSLLSHLSLKFPQVFHTLLFCFLRVDQKIVIVNHCFKVFDFY